MNVPSNFPTFFIVGAPRCGTTSLSHYLADHDQICFSRPKETHYLIRPPSDTSLSAYVQTYTDLFLDHHEDEPVIGEGSVSYLYKDEILRRILDLNPDARFIVSVRNPIDQLRSYHQRILFLMDEDVQDFRRAWDLQEERAEGRHIPERCRDVRLLMYREVGSLGTRVERLFEIAGRDRVHVVVFDDFVEDTRSVYENVCRFVGVRPDGRTTFPPKRTTHEYRFQWLQSLIHHPPKILTQFVGSKTVDKNWVQWGLPALMRFRNLLERINSTKKVPPSLSQETRDLLRETFASEIRLLSDLIDRDLTHWLESEGGRSGRTEDVYGTSRKELVSSD